MERNSLKRKREEEEEEEEEDIQDGDTILHRASSAGDTDTLVRVLSSQECDRREGILLWSRRNHRSETPLIRAAAGGHSECVKILLDNMNDDDVCAKDDVRESNQIVRYALSIDRSVSDLAFRRPTRSSVGTHGVELGSVFW